VRVIDGVEHRLTVLLVDFALIYQPCRDPAQRFTSAQMSGLRVHCLKQVGL